MEDKFLNFYRENVPSGDKENSFKIGTGNTNIKQKGKNVS